MASEEEQSYITRWKIWNHQHQPTGSSTIWDVTIPVPLFSRCQVHYFVFCSYYFFYKLRIFCCLNLKQKPESFLKLRRHQKQESLYCCCILCQWFFSQYFCLLIIRFVWSLCLLAWGYNSRVTLDCGACMCKVANFKTMLQVASLASSLVAQVL